MKSSEIALLFFILWSTVLECVLIYQYFKYKELLNIINDQDLEIEHLHQHFTKK